MFVKLGVTAFGGPAAHVALMRREVVERRHWVDGARFERMFAACNLIPGPSSTELAIYLGYKRAGWRALLLAGSLFILPAMLLMLVIAWAYRRFGAGHPATGILYGVRPVIVGIVVWALIDLSRRLVKRRALLALSLAAAGVALVNVNPVLILIAGGLLVAAITLRPRAAGAAALGLPAPLAVASLGPVATGKLLTVFLTFLKIGAISFGSGYVLLAFLRADFVTNLHWLTDRQLVDAVAIGQATPGPVFTTATFLGYLFAGLPGALVATVGIFLPGFVLVPFLDRIVEIAARRRGVQGFVDGANAAALGLIAAVTLQLGRAAVVDPITAVLGVLALAITFRWPTRSVIAVLGGAAAGLVTQLLH